MDLLFEATADLVAVLPNNESIEWRKSVHLKLERRGGANLIAQYDPEAAGRQVGNDRAFPL